MINKLKIGNVELENNLILAPMAGVTDLPFRLLCKEQGAALCCMEMVSAKGIYYNNKNTESLLTVDERERPVSLQLFGSDPEIMAAMAAKIEHRNFDILDINMGCPVPKVVNNGDGSALMKNPVLAGKIIEGMVKAIDKPVTVKIRKGFDDEHINAVEMAHVAQEGSLGLAGLFRCGQGFAQGLLLRQGLPGFGIHVREARAHTVHQMVRPVFRMTHAREAYGLPGFLSVHADHVSIGNHQVFFQSLPDMVRLDKLQEVLPVWFQDIFVTVCGHRLQIVESLSRPEAVQVSPCLVAHTPVLIQFQIVHAPVVGCQRRNQLALFLLLGLLRQQLILKGQPLFHLLVPCPVFRLGSFFFQLQLRILPDLADDKREQACQCQCCQHGLN